MKNLSRLLGITTIVVGAWISGCDSDEPKAEIGSEGNACYSNNTCNAGLSCLSDTCVDRGGNGDTGGATGDGDSGGTSGDGDSGGTMGDGDSGGTSGDGDSGGTSGDGGSNSGGTGGDGDTGGAPSAGGNNMGGAGNIGPWTLFDGTGTWIDGEDNTRGIQGSFFVLEDSMKDSEPVPDDDLSHTDLSPDEFAEDTSAPCVSGVIGAVTDIDGEECDPMDLGGTECEWSAVWGGGIGVNLNETGGEDSDVNAWNATAAGVTGFSFATSGSLGGAVLRFKAKMLGSDEDFCTNVAVGSTSVDLSELRHNCFAGGVATQALDLTQIEQINWQIVSDANTFFTVTDFCIDSLDAY